MIDWDRLNALRADIGEEDFTDVAFLFVREIHEKLESLRADPATAGPDDFHFLRGSAVNLGLRAFAQACTRAEAACSAGCRPDIDGIVALFTESLSAMAPTLPGVGNAA